MSDIESFRTMFKWLAQNIRWDAGIARRREDYQVCLMGTGSIASGYYKDCHTLADKYDKNLDAFMLNVEDAQKKLDEACIELDVYIRSKTEIK